MNIDHILHVLNAEDVDYILIGGMNFLLNHEPVLTYDVDVWVRDESSNLQRLHHALTLLHCQWGKDEASWGELPSEYEWLLRQQVFCLTSPHGAIDVFRSVLGLEERYSECFERSGKNQTAAGVPYRSLSDRDMLQCQLALPPALQKAERIRILSAL